MPCPYKCKRHRIRTNNCSGGVSRSVDRGVNGRAQAGVPVPRVIVAGECLKVTPGGVNPAPTKERNVDGKSVDEEKKLAGDAGGQPQAAGEFVVFVADCAREAIAEFLQEFLAVDEFLRPIFGIDA